MRVLVAFDKFKDALTATEACVAASAALRAKHPDWRFDLCPLTDGGEGFTATLAEATSRRLGEIAVIGPRGIMVPAPIALIPVDAIPAAARQRLGVAGPLAVADLASASGLALLAADERDPWHASTIGTGQLLRHAADRGASAILLGVGGSATNDLGLGALAALGLRFLDGSGRPVEAVTPANWTRIARIEGRVSLPPVFIACDVTNPLLGPRGATATFGPQKGLPPADLPRLEAEMARLAGMLASACGQPQALAEVAGTGAAGGISYGLMVAAGARLVPGFGLVADWLDLPARLRAADLVLTGEGRFDATSLGGKGPGAIAAEARQLEKPTHVFAGSLGVAADAHHHAITPAGMPLGEALPRTAELLAVAIGRVL